MSIFKSVNSVVRKMVIVDFFVNTAFGSFAPVFAIFITGQIKGGSASVAGIATAVYWIIKSIVQLPVARFLDTTDGERDDFWALFWGYLLSGLIPFAYLFVSEPLHLYVVQGLFGLIMAWTVPAWYSIFTRHVDRSHVGFEWSLESVLSVGIATAIASAAGGVIVDQFGFRVLFIAAGCISTLSSFGLLGLRKYIFSTPKVERMPPETSLHKR